MIKNNGTANLTHGNNIIGNNFVCVATTIIDSINLVKSNVKYNILYEY